MPPLALTLKDVLHYSIDYDPMKAVVDPHPLHSHPTTPFPYTATFTCADFQSFWDRERRAFPWVYYCEKNSRSFYFHSDSPDTPLPTFAAPTRFYGSTPGAKRRYDWSLKHVCRHWDQEHAVQLKRRRSVGQGCKASIRIRKLVAQDKVEVEYFWKHNNHSTTVRNDFPLGPNDFHWVQRLIQEGHQWEDFKTKLRPNEQQQQMIESGEAAVPPAHFIKYDDVRQGLYRKRKRIARKSTTISESVGLWIDDIQSKGGKGLFLRDSAGFQQEDFMIAWCTSFQLTVMAENTTSVCLDSHHKTIRLLEPTGEDDSYRPAYLLTLLVKDKTFPRGIPIAYMISNSESHPIIVKWLQWLKSDCKLQADHFIVDCSIAESEAIVKTFEGSSICYSALVGKIWEAQLKKDHSAKQTGEMLSLLNQVRNANSEEDLQVLWQTFVTKYPEAISFIHHVEENWMTTDRKQLWVKFARVGNHQIDTNDMIESWRKTLKKYHLGSERKICADYLIYMLQGVVNDDFRDTYSK